MRRRRYPSIVIGEQRKQLDRRADAQRRPQPIDEPRVAEALHGDREPPLEELLALCQGGGIEGARVHVLQCMKGPDCHWLLGDSADDTMRPRRIVRQTLSPIR